MRQLHVWVITLFFGIASVFLSFSSVSSPAFAATMLTFQVTNAPNPAIELNYVTFTIHQTNTPVYSGPIQLQCLASDGGYPLNSNGNMTNGSSSLTGFAPGLIANGYQASTLQISCYVFYSVNGTMERNFNSYPMSIRQLQIGDSFYRGDSSGPHETICANWQTVNYGQPCPQAPTPTTIPPTPTAIPPQPTATPVVVHQPTATPRPTSTPVVIQHPTATPIPATTTAPANVSPTPSATSLSPDSTTPTPTIVSPPPPQHSGLPGRVWFIVVVLGIGFTGAGFWFWLRTKK